MTNLTPTTVTVTEEQRKKDIKLHPSKEFMHYDILTFLKRQ